MFSPERRMMFFLRSTKTSMSSAIWRTTSPVWNQPPRHASSVASAFFRYPAKKPWRGPSGPPQRTSNSPAVPRGSAGELLVRWGGPEGPRHGFFAGYLKNAEATDEAWRGGWFHTGDVVRQMDDDMLVFVDRKKNIIRRSGENIAAAEVEACLQAHASVAQVAVIAVPDDVREEEVMACIVPMAGVADD